MLTDYIGCRQNIVLMPCMYIVYNLIIFDCLDISFLVMTTCVSEFVVGHHFLIMLLFCT